MTRRIAYRQLHALLVQALVVLAVLAAAPSAADTLPAASTTASSTTTTTTATATTSSKVDLSSYVHVLNHAAPIIGLVFGPVMCCFGLAWYSYVAQVLAFLAGSILFALGALLLADNYTTAAIVFMALAFITGGAISSALVRLRPAICTLAIGGASGIGLTYLVFLCAHLDLNNDKNPLLFVVATTLFVVCGTLAVRYEHVAVLVSTSAGGAYSWLYGVGYYAGAFPTWRAIYERTVDTSDATVPWTWWLYLAAYIVLVAWSVREQRRRYCIRKTRADECDASKASDMEAPEQGGEGTDARSPVTAETRTPTTPSTPYTRL